MKKIVILLTVLNIVFCVNNFSFARVPTEKELAAAEKEKLNNTQWMITVKPLSEKGRTESDVVTFSEGKIVSRNLENAGFEGTDFTVRVEEDGTVIWETMQADGKDNFAFWRGDIKDGLMRGIFTKRDNKGGTFDFSFTNQQQ